MASTTEEQARAEEPEQCEQSEQPEQAEQPQQAEQPEQAEQPQQAEQPEQPMDEQPHEAPAEQPEEKPQAAQPEQAAAVPEGEPEQKQEAGKDGQEEPKQSEEGKSEQSEKPQVLKRPKTAFWIFQEEVRAQVAQEIGSNRGSKVVAAMAAKWKALDDTARAVYTDKAKQSMDQYQKDLANGAVPASKKSAGKEGNSAGKVIKKATKASRMARSLRKLANRAAPKKPKGSYSIWLGENRQKIVEQLRAEGSANPTFEEIARASGKAWCALTPDQQAPFKERAGALSNKYKDISKACKEYTKANAKDLKGKAKAAARVKAKAAAKKGAKKAGAKKAEAKKAAKAKAKAQAKNPASAEKKEAAKKADTPKKRAASAAQLSTPTKKVAKKAAVANKAGGTYIDTAIEAEADKLGMAGSFRRLAEREDMKKFSQQVLLDALKAHGGLLHRAKDAILAGAA